MRRVGKVNHPKTGKPFLEFIADAVKYPDAPLYYSSNEIDVVLFELMATMRFLVDAPDVIRLETEVRAELDI
jgi:hypothetical protein